MIKLPAVGGKWRVAHGQDGFTDLVDTRNVNLDKVGTISLAKQPVTLYTNTQNANFGRVMALPFYGSAYYPVTTTNVFSYTPATGVITEQTNVGMSTHGIYSDAITFNSLILVSTNNGIDTYNGTTWTSAFSTLTASVPHPLCAVEFRPEFAVGDGSTVKTYTAAYSLQNTLALESQYTVTSIVSRGNNLYIGTRNSTGGTAKLFIWNGTGTTPQSAYSVSSDWIYSLVDWKDGIVLIASSGQLLRFNGGGFTELAHFPVYETGLSWSTNAASNSLLGKVPNRGMIAAGEVIYLNVDGSIQTGTEAYPGNFLQNQPSGLWVYDPSVGLYHKASGQYTQVSTITANALASDTLTFTSAHNCETGDEIRAVSVTNIPELSTGRDYFAINVSATSMKLAASPADAVAGRSITLSGAPNLDTFNVNTISAGAVTSYLPGAITANSQTTSQRFFGEEVLWSGSSADNTQASIKALMSFGTGRNVGSFVTSFLPASGLTDTFQKLFLACLTLLRSTDSIVVKYRLDYGPGLPTPARSNNSGIATWISTTSFSILTTTKDVKSASVGDEVYITEGAGAGYSAHITVIDSSTNTYVFTLDEAIPNIIVGDFSDIVIDNWTKLGVINSSTATIGEGFGELPVAKENSAIQFKVEMRGKDINVTGISSISTVSKKQT